MYYNNIREYKINRIIEGIKHMKIDIIVSADDIKTEKIKDKTVV